MIRAVERSIVCTAVFALLAGLPVATAAEWTFTPSHVFTSSVSGKRILELDDGARAVRELGVDELTDPRSIAFGPDGRLYIADGNRIAVLDADGLLWKSLGEGTGLAGARGLAFGPDGNLFVTSQDRVLELSPQGDLVREIGVGDGLVVPTALTFGADGHLFVAASASNRVFEYDHGGHMVRTIGEGSDLAIPMALAFGPSGLLYVSSFFGSSVLAFAADGTVQQTISDASLLFPSGLTFGPNGHLFVASFFGAVVVEFDAGGEKVRDLPVPENANHPEGIVFSPFRMPVRVSGSLVTSGGVPAALDEDATLAVAPGSRTLMLQLTDGAGGNDLASAYGTHAIVFHGFETGEEPSAKKRLAQGVQIASPGMIAGQASLMVTVTGKPQAWGDGKAFTPTSLKGTLHRATAATIFKGTLKLASKH